MLTILLQMNNLQKVFVHADEILTVLFQEYPLTREMHEDFKNKLVEQTKEKSSPEFFWLYGKWMKNEKEETTDTQLKNFTDKVKSIKEIRAQTILKAKPVEEVISVEVDKKQQEDYVLTHNFEQMILHTVYINLILLRTPLYQKVISWIQKIILLIMMSGILAKGHIKRTFVSCIPKSRKNKILIFIIQLSLPILLYYLVCVKC